MPRGGANNIRVHVCPDGEERRVEPVYFREEVEPGRRVFKRESWFCHKCRYSDGNWTPTPRTSQDPG